MPEKVTMHRDNGESVEVDAIDARDAVKRHPDEWSMKPFPKKEQADELKKDLAAARKAVKGAEKAVAEAKTPEDKDKAEELLGQANEELKRLEAL